MKLRFSLLTLVVLSTSIFAADKKDEITSAVFGKTSDGTQVEIYTLHNATGMEAKIMTYGGVVVSLTAPDKKGAMVDVVCGFDKLEDYEDGGTYFGALIGRYANRISAGKFTLEGKDYQLAVNSGVNTLHGGNIGFDKVVWKARPLTTKNGPSLELTHLSKDGEENFPGNLTVTATYTLTDKNELQLDFKATTDKTTVLNLSHHSYFNLAGHGEGTILDHEVTINADKVIAIGQTRCPTGEIRSVEGSPMDFRKQTAVGARIDADYDQVKIARGYDHCWVINKKPGELALAAKVVDPKSGRVMEVLTTEPGLQFYSGNSLGDLENAKAGKSYRFRGALCMEPGHFPDSPNHPEFPTTTLKPGEVFTSTIIYRFSAQ